MFIILNNDIADLEKNLLNAELFVHLNIPGAKPSIYSSDLSEKSWSNSICSIENPKRSRRIFNPLTENR
jgi:hypothetical protein